MSRQEAKREGLVFIDVDYGKHGAKQPGPAEEAVSRPLSAQGFDDVELPPSADMRSDRTLDESPLAGLTPLEDPLTSMVSEQARGPGPTMAEFESTAFSSEEMHADIEPLAIEHTSYDTLSSAPVGVDSAWP